MTNADGILISDNPYASLSFDTNETCVNKLCFTLCLDSTFLLGAVGTVRSIRKFYGRDEADIIVFVDKDFGDFSDFCAEQGAEVHYFSEIEGWVLPLVYADPTYASDSSHFYHPNFRLIPGLDHALPEDSGFHTIRHLHPLNVKAYCTGYCLCIRNYARVVHIDADAFLLARIDEMFVLHGHPNTVIAFEDGEDELDNLEVLFGVSKPVDFSATAYGFNAGLVFYVNGPAVRQLMRDFMFFIESCYHYTHAGYFSDQGILRALVAIYHMGGRIHYYQEDAVNWNPTYFRADDMWLDDTRGVWINGNNNAKQFVWHSAGGERLWSGRHASPSVNAAWRWVGGSYSDHCSKGIRSNGYSHGSDDGILTSGAAEVPYYEQILADDQFLDKLCFAVCLNEKYILGGEGLIRSIRKFYGRDEADIIVFVDKDFGDFSDFCAEQGAEVHYFSEIEGWVLPLVYADPTYASDSSHFYHPNFRLIPGLDHALPEDSGFHTIRHLHPLNVKAYCTGYCLCIRNYARVVHIDADAFLLARIDEMFVLHGHPNTVIAFEDDEDELPKFEVMFSIKKPLSFHRSHYGFNAGIVFYVNGKGTKLLMRDFMFFIESCYHYTHAGSYNDADQGLIRALVAKHAILGNIRFYREDNVNWNPTWKRGEDLFFDVEQQEWINRWNGKKQYLWHDPTGCGCDGRIWTGQHRSFSAMVAWEYVGGTFEISPFAPSGLSLDKSQALASVVNSNFLTGVSACLDLLEIGREAGATICTIATLLNKQKFDIRVHACRCGASAPLLPSLQDPSRGGIKIDLQCPCQVDEASMGMVAEDFLEQFGGRRFDVIYVNSDLAYASTLRHCLIARKLAKKHALIMGSGADQDYVMSAVRDAFPLYALETKEAHWIAHIPDDSRTSFRAMHLQLEKSFSFNGAAMAQ